MEPVDGGVPLAALIDAIKRSIRVAGTGAGLRVETATLTIATVTARTAGGGLEFRVPLIGTPVRVGASATRRHAHTVEIVFAPPPPPQFEIRDAAVEQALVDAIRTLGDALRHAAAGDDPLLLQTGTISLSFGVTDAGKITLGLDGEFSDELTNGLVLSFLPA